MITEKPAAEQVRAAREAANLTLKEAAQHFGMVLNAWQKKESSGSSHRDLSIGEYNYLLLLANQHPDFYLINRLPTERNFRQEAAQAALDLAQYLAAGDSSVVVLPSVVATKLEILSKHVDSIKSEWKQSIDDNFPDEH